VKGIFRGSGTTFLRESIGNATFFSVYEYMRYHMHSSIKPASSNYNNLIEIGIGVVTGGVSGVAVSILRT
jgi:solute carrier family 25 (mitochondrial carnitine/acylcarnitine transporter), member 20/29